MEDLPLPSQQNIKKDLRCKLLSVAAIQNINALYTSFILKRRRKLNDRCGGGGMPTAVTFCILVQSVCPLYLSLEVIEFDSMHLSVTREPSTVKTFAFKSTRFSKTKMNKVYQYASKQVYPVRKESASILVGKTRVHVPGAIDGGFFFFCALIRNQQRGGNRFREIFKVYDNRKCASRCSLWAKGETFSLNLYKIRLPYKLRTLALARQSPCTYSSKALGIFRAKVFFRLQGRETFI